MSELASLTASDTLGTIPGFTLYRLNHAAIGEVESHLQRWHVEKATRSTKLLAPDLRQEVIAKVTSDATFFLVNGTATFDRQLQSSDGKYVSIAASIRIRDPKLNDEQLLATLNGLDKDVITHAVDWVWERDAATLAAK
jgi:hypothetical protein